MNWETFEKENDFEKTIYDLTKKSIEIIKDSEDFKNTIFSAFAFNCNSFYWDISLSFNSNLEIDVRKEWLYPPDWSNECLEYDLKKLEKLWNSNYKKIQKDFYEVIEFEENEKKLEKFGNWFLDSLRKVLVKLENEKIFEEIKITKNFWTLVTEIDSNNKKEELLLEKVRKDFYLKR